MKTPEKDSSLSLRCGGVFFASAAFPTLRINHKKTRKRTATFSSGLLDIAAEDRRGFRLRSLALFVGDMCLRWRMQKTGYTMGYANAKSP
jgi:hypothetical protein